MPQLETYQDLLNKIGIAKAERDKLYGSIYDPNWKGGNWMQASINECGKEYKASEPKGSSYYPVYSDTVVKQEKCNYVIDLINERIKIINKLDADILAWQTQVDTMLKDPALLQDIKDAKLKRQIKITATVVIVVVVIVSGYFLWKKYGQ